MASFGNIKTKISVKDSDKLFANIRKKVDRAGYRAVQVTQKQINEDIKEIVVPVILKGFANNRVIKALLGYNAGSKNGDDLQAEFGLDNEMAEEFVSDFKSKLEKASYIKFGTPKISKRGTNVSASINFSYYDTDLLFSLAYSKNASYRSITQKDGKTVSEDVPWFYWTITQQDDVKPEWGISYELTQRQSQISRTGRAVMTKSPGNRYDLPSIVKSSDSNWVEEQFFKSKFQIERAIIKLVQKRIKPNFQRAFRQAK